MQLTISKLVFISLMNFSILYSSFSLYGQTSEPPQTIKGLEFSICKGDAVHLSSLHKPADIIKIVDENAGPSKPKNSLEDPSTLAIEPNGPLINYACIPPVLEVVPNKDWTLDENGVVVLSPAETTTYKIRYLSVDQCPNGRPSTVKINVACSVQNNAMTNDFEWLHNLVNEEGCGINLIDVYERNNSKFVYVEAINAKVLYYEDGSILCTDAKLCLDFYNLSNKKNSWSCKQVKENEDAANQIFGTYNWLENEVDKGNCSNESITVYSYGSYKFIVVYNGLNGYKIYDETGSFSYFTTVGFDFLGDFEAFKLYSWTCDDNFSVRTSSANKSVQSATFQLFPNPTKNEVFLNLDILDTNIYSDPKISIYSVSGQLMLKISPQEDDFFVHILELDVSTLIRGMYLVELQANDQLFYEKLLIE